MRLVNVWLVAAYPMSCTLTHKDTPTTELHVSSLQWTAAFVHGVSMVDWHRFSEEQIDEIVVAQAEDNMAWEEPILVRRDTTTTVSLPPELAARAAFLAQLHRVPSVEDWLRVIIQERIDFEEAAFAGLKQALAAKGSE
jgi:hypothetical protein